MIRLVTTKKATVMEIAFERDVKIAENYQDLARGKRAYQADDSCLLLADEGNVLKILPGPDIVEHLVFQQLTAYAIRKGKPVEIVDCPNLAHLRKLDKLVVMLNNLVDN